MSAFIKIKSSLLSGLVILLVSFCCLQAQVLSFEDFLEIPLSDGTNVLLYKNLNSDKNEYFYLPPSSSIRLATREDGVPEFLFAKYTTEERADAGGVQGAITHFLVEWGLSENQLSELNTKLGNKISEAIVSGPVRLKSEMNNSFSIVSATLNAEEFTSTLVTSGIAPPMPGNKAAVAAKLDKYGAQLLASTFEKSRSIADVSLVMNYTYTLYVDAVNASISCDWVRFERESESIAEDYLRAELDNDGAFDQALNVYTQISEELGASNLGCAASPSFSAMVAAQMTADQINGDSTDIWLKLSNNNDLQGQLIRAGSVADKTIGNTSGSSSSGSAYEYYVGESVMRNIISFMYESEVINLEYQESGEVDDEKIKTIRDAFFDYFLNAFANQDFPQASDNRITGIDRGSEDLRPDDSEGAYSFRGCDQYESIKRKTKRIELSGIRLPVKLNHQMVENLARTYDQVRNNPKCIYSINLNDPFYSHREINFILDAESREIFEDEINFVTVNVRKRRSSGNDFQDAITIDAGDLQTRGTLATLTYARGEDRNSDVYQYKVQWSLRGGNLHPENPQWINGDWQGVSLAAPIMPRNIEFEADLEELREKGVRRASLQLRYQKFGKEYESFIPLTVSRGNPLVEETIYVDRDMPGYAYRIILTHQNHGKLALDWEGELTDNYVFAVLPDQFADRRFIDRLSRAAKEFVPQSKSNVEIQSPAERILDKVLKALEHFTK